MFLNSESIPTKSLCLSSAVESHRYEEVYGTSDSDDSPGLQVAPLEVASEPESSRRTGSADAFAPNLLHCHQFLG
jgi:hypothetical protein